MMEPDDDVGIYRPTGRVYRQSVVRLITKIFVFERLVTGRNLSSHIKVHTQAGGAFDRVELSKV